MWHYLKSAIEEIMGSQNEEKLQELAILLSEDNDKLSSVLEAPILKIIETKNSKELNQLLSLFAAQSFYALNFFLKNFCQVFFLQE